MTDKILSKMRSSVGSPLPLASRYQERSADRSGYLERGRECSRLTLPQILPHSEEIYDRGGFANQQGFTSIGAKCVKHLANKLVNNMFPAGRSFFSLDFTAEAAGTLKEEFDSVSFNTLLNVAENKVHAYESKIAARVAYVEAFLHLLIGGNGLLYLPDRGFLQLIPLNRYVVERDLTGDFLEVIMRQTKNYRALSQDTRDILESVRKKEKRNDKEEVDIYTIVYKIDEDKYAIAQSVDEVVIRTAIEINKEALPFNPLVHNLSSGENYGRGLVEDVIGDLYAAHFLAEAMAKGMALMSDVKYFLKDGSTMDIEQVASAPMGEWLPGNPEDVGILQLEKYANFVPVKEAYNDYQRSLGQTFLLNSAVRRDAERVTTVELRMDAQELSTSLGGNYSMYGQTFQAPQAWLYLNRIGFPLNKQQVEVNVVTGLESYAKAGDMEKLYTFTELLQLTNAWPQEVRSGTNFDKYSQHAANMLSMDLPFLKTEEEKQAEAEAQQTDMMAGEAAKAIPDVIKEQVQGGQING